METSMVDSYWGDECCARAIVVKKHDATDDSQLSLKVNDRVIILEQDDTGWWGGHLEGKEKTGWFPGSCVRLTHQEKPDMSLSSPARQTPTESKQAGVDFLQQDLMDLKHEKASLEDKLRGLERKSEEDQKTIYQLKQSEAKLEAQMSAERSQKKQLQEKINQLQEEISRLQAKLEVAEGKIESLSSQKVEKLEKERTEAIEAAPKHVSDNRAAPTPVSTESSDAPPPGCVKTIRDAFERGSTPQRDRGHTNYGSRNSYGTAQGASREVPPSLLSSGRFVGPVENRDTDFGLSPIRRGSRPRPWGSEVKGMPQGSLTNTPVRCWRHLLFG